MERDALESDCLRSPGLEGCHGVHGPWLQTVPFDVCAMWEEGE